jgi:hypothetical protein
MAEICATHEQSMYVTGLQGKSDDILPSFPLLMWVEFLPAHRRQVIQNCVSVLLISQSVFCSAGSSFPARKTRSIVTRGFTTRFCHTRRLAGKPRRGSCDAFPVLSRLFRAPNHSERDKEITHQINADIPRTISPPRITEGMSEEEWRATWDPEELEVRKEKLRRILTAYSRHCPGVGYCQGLNYVGNRLLDIMEQDEEQVRETRRRRPATLTVEQAFWCLAQMVGRPGRALVPSDYYTTMVGVIVDQQVFASRAARPLQHTLTDQQVFASLLDELFPQVRAHLTALGGSGLELPLMSTEWFLTMFSTQVRSPCVAVRVLRGRVAVLRWCCSVVAGVSQYCGGCVVRRAASAPRQLTVSLRRPRPPTLPPHCLPTAHCPLPTAHCPLPTAHCPLPTAHCPLPTAHCRATRPRDCWLSGTRCCCTTPTR